MKPPIDVLLVDDSLSDAKLVERWLAASRLVKRVHAVQDGESALAFLQGKGAFAGVERPGLVLLDVTLPRMSGLEVLAEIKADAELTNIPVVMLTSSAFDKIRQQAEQLHVDLFLTKPADADEFTALVRALEAFWQDRGGDGSTAGS